MELDETVVEKMLDGMRETSVEHVAHRCAIRGNYRTVAGFGDVVSFRDRRRGRRRVFRKELARVEIDVCRFLDKSGKGSDERGRGNVVEKGKSAEFESAEPNLPSLLRTRIQAPQAFFVVFPALREKPRQLGIRQSGNIERTLRNRLGKYRFQKRRSVFEIGFRDEQERIGPRSDESGDSGKMESVGFFSKSERQRDEPRERIGIAKLFPIGQMERIREFRIGSLQFERHVPNGRHRRSVTRFRFRVRKNRKYVGRGLSFQNIDKRSEVGSIRNVHSVFGDGGKTPFRINDAAARLEIFVFDVGAAFRIHARKFLDNDVVDGTPLSFLRIPWRLFPNGREASYAIR